MAAPCASIALKALERGPFAALLFVNIFGSYVLDVWGIVPPEYKTIVDVYVIVMMTVLPTLHITQSWMKYRREVERQREFFSHSEAPDTERFFPDTRFCRKGKHD